MGAMARREERKGGGEMLADEELGMGKVEAGLDAAMVLAGARRTRIGAWKVASESQTSA